MASQYIQQSLQKHIEQAQGEIQRQFVQMYREPSPDSLHLTMSFAEKVACGATRSTSLHYWPQTRSVCCILQQYVGELFI